MQSPGAHGVGAPVLPAEALAVEDVEELLVVGVDVDRHRALARGDPVAAEPGARRAGRGAQAPARPAQLLALDHAGLDVVDVDDHRGAGSLAWEPARRERPRALLLIPRVKDSPMAGRIRR